MKPIKDQRRKVNGLIEVFDRLAGGQGYAGINVFDPGCTGDASWNIQINLERDGLQFGRKNISTSDLRKAINDLLESRER